MAETRPTPFVPMSWLARLMTGAVACQWRYWWNTQHALTRRLPDSFDSVTWQVNHARLVSDLRLRLAAGGWTVQPSVGVQMSLPDCPALIRGHRRPPALG